MSNRLKSLRIKNKLSIEKIAQKLGVCKKTVFNYENNATEIPSDILIKMSNIYNVSTDYILGLKDYTGVIFTDNNKNVLAMVRQNEIVEHDGFKVILSKD